MKKHLLTAVVLGGLVLAISSCKKDDNPDTTTTTPTSTYTASSNAIAATINGTAMPIDASTVNNNSGSVYVHGSHTGVDSTIAVVVPATAMPGTYSASAFGNFQITYSNGTDFFSPLTASDGSIVVTSNDTDHKAIKGTFTGTLTSLSGTGETRTLTNGSFTANY